MTERLLTTVVGSYPQPEWLVDRKNLQSRLPPRIRAQEIWRIPEPLLQQAQDDATLLAIRDMERADARQGIEAILQRLLEARLISVGIGRDGEGGRVVAAGAA